VMDAALLLGLVLAALAGIGAALISLKSNAKFMGDLSIDEILAFRFLLSGVVATGVAFSTGASLGGEVGLAEVFGLSGNHQLAQKKYRAQEKGGRRENHNLPTTELETNTRQRKCL